MSAPVLIDWTGVRQSDVDRFQKRVHAGDPADCWDWQAGRSTNGYGKFWLLGRTVYAHRFAYEQTVGLIPAGLTIDHLCRNRGCVNPAHMEIVTMVENVMRGDAAPAINARKTHCNRGHDLSGAYIAPGGYRVCRVCRLDAKRRYLQRVRAAAA